VLALVLIWTSIPASGTYVVWKWLQAGKDILPWRWVIPACLLLIAVLVTVHIVRLKTLGIGEKK
jgi:drug/metabolite transporter superfamily protein YnfA